MFGTLKPSYKRLYSVDVRKDWTFATVLDQDGRVVVQRKLANKMLPASLKVLMLKDRFGDFNPCYLITQALVGMGFRVEVGHPKKTRYIAVLREKVKRRAFLVRQRAKLMTKIRGLSLFTCKGFDWLESWSWPINCYSRLILAFNGENRRLNLELRRWLVG